MTERTVDSGLNVCRMLNVVCSIAIVLSYIRNSFPREFNNVILATAISIYSAGATIEIEVELERDHWTDKFNKIPLATRTMQNERRWALARCGRGINGEQGEEAFVP
ncbi:hypothetical protein KQX54_011630 [Cotesia glomerata]|uniref:Uncharacterized protein n=1 Tax=Cotesia glomerata TaxID=32391 RepID=A0AAV7J0C3_COTGL|nr:hypothetical protein KQX54_011630 [Cotesia glomerata]